VAVTSPGKSMVAVAWKGAGQWAWQLLTTERDQLSLVNFSFRQQTAAYPRKDW